MDLEELQDRELERDEFVEKQIQKAYQKMSDIEDDSFTLGLAGVLVRYLKEKKQGIENFEVIEDGPDGFFFIDFFGDVICFARNIAERNEIVARFLSKILISGLALFHYELNKGEEIELPYKDFD